jgi:beta-N-acetylhexosaminidase
MRRDGRLVASGSGLRRGRARLWRGRGGLVLATWRRAGVASVATALVLPLAVGVGVPDKPPAELAMSAQNAWTDRVPVAVTTKQLTSNERSCTNLSVVQGWPLERRVMRLIVAPSYDFNLPQLRSVIRAGIGGLLFLGPGPPPVDLARLVAAAKVSPVGGAPILTMADEEGGGIQRLSGLVRSFPWPRNMAATNTVSQVNAIAKRVGRQMRAAGVDMDLAPVLDVDGRPGPNNSNPDGARSFSAVTGVAGAYGVAFMKGLAAGGELAAVKHFPGLGGSTGNSDVGPATTLRYSELRSVGLPPFVKAIAAGAPAVLVANDVVPGLTTAPASLSSAVIQGLLRAKLNFKGAALTDSLSAGAISAAGYNLSAASVAAVRAGADLILFGSTLNPAQVALLAPARVATSVDGIANALSAAVAAGKISETQLNTAVDRVIALQGARLCPPPRIAGTGGGIRP